MRMSLAVRGCVLAVAGSLGLGASCWATNTTRVPLTPEVAVATVRLMYNSGESSSINTDGSVSISPDGSRYVARLVRGDIERNGVWVEFLTGDLKTLRGATSAKVAARLFTSGKGSNWLFGADHDTSDQTNAIRWLNNDQIAVLNSDDRGIRQVVRIDLRGGAAKYLTSHPTQVVSFDVSSDGAVLYTAQAQLKTTPISTLLQEGFVVDDATDAASLIRGEVGGGSFLDRFWNVEWFIQDESRPTRRKLDVNTLETDRYYLHEIRFSPDGHSAVISATPPSIQSNWAANESSLIRERVREAQLDRWAYMPRALQRHYVVETDGGSVRSLWDSPTLGSLTKATWSPSGKSVLLAPTFLPAGTGRGDNREGNAAAIVDVSTGMHQELPVTFQWEPQTQRTTISVHWLSESHVRVVERGSGSCRRYDFRRAESSGAWNGVATQPSCGSMSTERIRVEAREDIETPPRLYAVDVRTNESRIIVDPNPGLTDKFELGDVKRVGGIISQDERWAGLLFYPVNYRKGERYPLVIQSVYGGIAERFTLYGPGTLGPSLIAAYPGRLLAAQGIAVLHMDIDRRTRAASNTNEAARRTQAFEAAVTQLAAEGLIDPEKVGLLGFSRNGYFVEYAITHSNFPYAAAIAADNFDPSYFPTILIGDIAGAVAVHGAAPIGEGLHTWLAMAPGFNVDKIRTPLRLIEQSHGVLGILQHWEILRLSRYLKKPVELYVMPEAGAGAHNSQNPRQIIAIQESSLDWFNFWLRNVEDAAHDKTAQYLRWRKLRELSGRPDSVSSSLLK